MTRHELAELNDARDLHLKANDWINTLIASGVSPRAAAAAMLTAVTEQALLDGGPEKTAAFLKHQAEMVETSGTDWLAALKSCQ